MNSSNQYPKRLAFIRHGRDMKSKTGKSKSGTYVDILDGLMVSTVSIGERAKAFVEHEVDAIMGARIAGWTNDEIRELVKQLEANRVNFAPTAGIATRRCSDPNDKLRAELSRTGARRCGHEAND